MKKKTIALAGNPNVGKSTVFNALTGMNQHTGNWPGKTVSGAVGRLKYKDAAFEFIDLPGAYSLNSASPDEAVTGEYIRSNQADIVLIIADATCLKRNLLLTLDILRITTNAILCVNLMDEAAKKGIEPDIYKLQSLLHIPVLPITARSKKGINRLLDALYAFEPASGTKSHCEFSTSGADIEHIYKQCVHIKNLEPHSFDRKLDRIVTSRSLGFPIMILLLAFIFWLTMVGANYPSAVLASFFASLDEKLRTLLCAAEAPEILISALMDGLYTTLTWVISVMLPPMAIFFPLFTLLEDFGYLPRVAFNLDNIFRRCGIHGKHSLTMCMGFGCNACGVMGCRIIESPRERLIAILTNNLVPCNGRFPTLISLILIFFVAGTSLFATFKAGLLLTFFILLGVAATLLISKVLSKTILQGIPSSFILELPPYRVPKFSSVIIRSVTDRTLFVLGRAVTVAAPFGIVIWALANMHCGDTTLLNHCTEFLDPFGRYLGVDGVIMMAFILGFPANEIIIPVMLMCYTQNGMLTDYNSLTQLHETLAGCGWTAQTALSVILLCIFHFPCGTTCLTIKKETGSIGWTILAFLLPTAVGVLLCFIINVACRILP